MKLFLLLSSFFILSCSNAQNKKYDLADPKEFVLYLIKLSSDGTKKDWSGVLSKTIKERQKDNVDGHFEVWSKAFISLAKKCNNDFDKLVVTYDESKSTIQIHDSFQIIVSKENGEFKINEN